MFIDRNLPMEELSRLGGPSAAGAGAPGPAPGPEKPLSRRVGVVGHRGDNCCAPENTLAAIRQAFDKGAEYVEVDVRRTANGDLVLLHDETVDRTTDGRGRVADLTLWELKALDAGSWHSPKFAGEKIPTLAEALLAAKGRGKLILDVKALDVGQDIRRALSEAGVGPDAILPVMNVDARALADFRKHLGGAVLLWGEAPDPSALDALKASGVGGFEVPFWTVKPPFLEAARARGMPVIVYTVIAPDTMRWLADDVGVDVIETDFPGVLNSLRPKLQP
ncbi:MAG TPA: hydrolase [Elusimicrobia bacterium]|nr:hydrolase [Elusimicrobiota bacterium]